MEELCCCQTDQHRQRLRHQQRRSRCRKPLGSTLGSEYGVAVTPEGLPFSMSGVAIPERCCPQRCDDDDVTTAAEVAEDRDENNNNVTNSSIAVIVVGQGQSAFGAPLDSCQGSGKLRPSWTLKKPALPFLLLILSLIHICQGRTAFEKMTDIDYVGETYYTIRNLSLYECQGWCREEPECSAASFSFVVNPNVSPPRQETVCLLQNSTQATNPSAKPMKAKNQYYMVKMSVRSDKVCRRPWNFERVPNAMIRDHDKALIFTSTKEACLAACLNEKSFLCRSAEYNYVTLQCRLSDLDRRNDPDDDGSTALIEAQGVDYFENLCLKGSEACDNAQRQFATPRFGIPAQKLSLHVGAYFYVDKELMANSDAACQRACLLESEFLCRSFLYLGPPTGTEYNCRLYHLDHWTLPDGAAAFLESQTPLVAEGDRIGSYFENRCERSLSGAAGIVPLDGSLPPELISVLQPGQPQLQQQLQQQQQQQQTSGSIGTGPNGAGGLTPSKPGGASSASGGSLVGQGGLAGGPGGGLAGKPVGGPAGGPSGGPAGSSAGGAAGGPVGNPTGGLLGGGPGSTINNGLGLVPGGSLIPGSFGGGQGGGTGAQQGGSSNGGLAGGVGVGAGANGNNVGLFPMNGGVRPPSPVNDIDFGDPDVNCDNQGTCYDVTVHCKDSRIVVNVATNRGFSGRIYALGRSETCNVDVINSDTFRLDLTMSGQDCNTQSVNGVYTNTVVVQRHSVVMTKTDKIYKVRCTYDTSSRNITFGMMPIRDPDMISVTSAPEAPAPKISILDSRGKEVETVRIGDKLTFKVEIPEGTPYGIFARSCVAMAKDSRSTFAIIDDDGCPVDPTIFPGFVPEGSSLVSRYEAFRFTESYGVIFQCNVKYCLGPCAPVNCGKGRDSSESWGKRRRRRRALGPPFGDPDSPELASVNEITSESSSSPQMRLSREIIVLDIGDEQNSPLDDHLHGQRRRGGGGNQDQVHQHQDSLSSSSVTRKGSHSNATDYHASPVDWAAKASSEGSFDDDQDAMMTMTDSIECPDNRSSVLALAVTCALLVALYVSTVFCFCFRKAVKLQDGSSTSSTCSSPLSSSSKKAFAVPVATAADFGFRPGYTGGDPRDYMR